MAISFDDYTDVYLQPSDERGVDENTASTISVSWKGPYSELVTASASFAQGDELPSPYTGWFAKSWSIKKGLAGNAILTIIAAPADETDSTTSSSQPFRDVWSIKSVRNDVSIMAYCGDSIGSSPQRAWIEKWMAEKNADVAQAGDFTDSDGTVVDVSAASPATAALIAKMMKGVESVMRFYPLVTRKRYYYSAPSDVLDEVGVIDDPPEPDTTNGIVKASSGLNAKLALYQWLKCQDDADEQADHTWIRTEAWMGILKAGAPNDEPWDADLYGPHRWTMPYYGDTVA